MRIAVLNGPNLDRLGTREREIYGAESLGDVESRLRELAGDLGVDLVFFQSNSEGDLVDAIWDAADGCDGIVINPAAYTHYSIAVRDALSGAGLPTVEVHISNVHDREEFRSRSVVAPACTGGIWGLGTAGYDLALRALVQMLA